MFVVACLCLQETAINIGYACSLITDDMTQFQMQGACLEVDKLEAEGRVSCALGSGVGGVLWLHVRHVVQCSSCSGLI